MASRFVVRPSKYRHVYGQPAKRSECFDGVKPSRNANDSNVVKANPVFVGVNWEASGGGAFAVLNQKTDVGKLSSSPNLFTGHKAAVLDIDFHPFNDYIVASASEDTKVNVWQIPEVLDAPQGTPALVLNGHGRKVMFLQFHPTASNVLASVSADLTIKLWDIEHGKQRSELTGLSDLVQSVSFNADGSSLAVTSKDKKLRIFDVRTGKVTHEVVNHEGVKNQRVIWLGNSPRIATTGFSKTSDRQMIVRDINNISEALVCENIDTSSGVLMPFYDEDSKMLYLAGKGDGNIRYYEMTDEKPWQFLLTQYGSNDPQRGMGWLPKRGVNVSQCEIARVFKLTNNLIEPISFVVPRKSDNFQDDLFPDCISAVPPLTADEFFDGKSALPLRMSMNTNGTPVVARAAVHFSAAAAVAEEKAPAAVAAKPAPAATSTWSAPAAKAPAPAAPVAAAAAAAPSHNETALHAEVTALKKEHERVLAEHAHLKAEHEHLTKENARLHAENAHLHKQLDLAANHAAELTTEKADLVAQVAAKDREITEWERAHEEQAAAHAAIQEDNEAANEEEHEVEVQHEEEADA